jgi:hypothetical protein
VENSSRFLDGLGDCSTGHLEALAAAPRVLILVAPMNYMLGKKRFAT